MQKITINVECKALKETLTSDASFAAFVAALSTRFKQSEIRRMRCATNGMPITCNEDFLRVVNSCDNEINLLLGRPWLLKHRLVLNIVPAEEENLRKMWELGFKAVRRNLKILRKNNGDCEKTIEILTKIRQDRKPSRKRSREPELDKREHKKRNCRTGTKMEKETPGTVGDWPEGKTVLFIDGNNMFFMTAGLRALTLRGTKGNTEKVLAAISEAFARVKGIGTILMFDSTENTSKKTLDNGLEFIVSSALPHFKTSDDAMVDWASSSGHGATAVFITSDRGLRTRLTEVGGTVIKTGTFLAHAHLLLSGLEGGNYQNWVDEWISSMEW